MNAIEKLESDGVMDPPAGCPFTLEQVLDEGFLP